ISDVEKAYLMISVDPPDRDALRFLWVNTNKQICHYRFKVVPFGTSASPFLLYAVMQDLFTRYADEFRDIIPIIKNRFYVDDLIITFTNANPISLTRFRERVVELFQRGGMNIRKWM